MASCDEKLAMCSKLGATATVNYKTHPNFSEQVLELTNGRGVNVIEDPVLGGDHFNQNLSSLAMDSRWVLYGSMGGIKVKEANMAKLLMKRSSILTSTLRNRNDHYKSDLVWRFKNETASLFKEGKLKPVVDKVFGLSEVAEAHRYLESNKNVGKVVLRYDL